MTKKYLHLFPKPLLDDLVSGRWLPVIGAGMSLNAQIPFGKKMPLWPDLGNALAKELVDFSSNGTLDAISAYEHEFGRAKLIERLTEILLIRDAQPGDAHKAFCSMPFDIVCTTNFDFLLERQYELTPRYVYPVVDEEQLSINGSTTGTLLLKLHGDLRHPSRLIVTEADYDAFLVRFPLIATYLSNQLITKTAVFFGYSLDDPDFRQIWNVVSERLGRTRRMAYAVMVDARTSDIARFERRGVKVINIPGSKDKYGLILSDVFRELLEYIRDNVISVSQVTEEEPLRELQLPRDATTRLCLFSIPIELVSLYRSRIFPVVAEMGFVPVTADDIISPGDSINAKIDTLIDRASVMIVELSSEWTRAEYDLALARKKDVKSANRHKLHIIIVTTEQDSPVSSLWPRIVRRSNFILEQDEKFVEDLSSILKKISEEIGIGGTNEPSRLLKAKEFRAAVISAMTMLESRLRQIDFQRTNIVVSDAILNRPMRTTSLRDLINVAVMHDYITSEESMKLGEWMKIRNMAVHTGEQVSNKVAREIVEGCSLIVERLRRATNISRSDS